MANRTLKLNESEIEKYSNLCSKSLDDFENSVIFGDFFDYSESLPEKYFDLVILDPPYNLNKDFANDSSFRFIDENEYYFYCCKILNALKISLKKESLLYFCIDWKSSIAVFQALRDCGFIVHNRIVWERDKGRGSKKNWKNNTEDIYMAGLSKDYYFDVDSVKIKRKVLTGYKSKDWFFENGKKMRFTYPSNIWTNITIPFWSMPENTEHPTQKPEKLIAKLILSSCKSGGNILDPFSGSGTTGVVAKKLGRNFTLFEISKKWAATSKYRIEKTFFGDSIQGYNENVFLDRNFNT